MAQILSGKYYENSRTLTREERRQAARNIARARRDNPLRRVRLACDLHGRRDPLAQLGDHVWCDEHSDYSEVVQVTE